MAEKTEKPTPKKIRDSRKKGQVANSKDVVSCILICMLFVYMWSMAPYYITQLKEMIALVAYTYDEPFRTGLGLLFGGIVTTAIKLILPLLGLVIVFAIAANMIQIGVIFSVEPIKPSLKKINPVEGAKKIFSKKSLFEVFKTLIKILLLSSLIYVLLKRNINDLSSIPYCGMPCLLVVIAHLFTWLFIFSAFAFIIIAIIDFYFQKSQHIKQLKMTKSEVQKEYKDTEGDPQIKGKRKEIHREILDSDVKQKIRGSSAVVTNPEHIAVAIYYKQGVTALPIVVMMAVDEAAQKVKRVAAEEKIPIMENVPLARALLAEGEVNNYIPATLIEPIVEVLKWVKSLEEEQEQQSRE